MARGRISVETIGQRFPPSDPASRYHLDQNTVIGVRPDTAFIVTRQPVSFVEMAGRVSVTAVPSDDFPQSTEYAFHPLPGSKVNLKIGDQPLVISRS